MNAAFEVIEDTKQAQVLLHPARIALLERLDEPASAASLARALELPRQRVNYPGGIAQQDDAVFVDRTFQYLLCQRKYKPFVYLDGVTQALF